jgi:hypothetical protein
MGKGLPRTMKRAANNAANQSVIKRTIPIVGLAVEVDGASGVGFGSAVLGGLPAGNLAILAAVAYLQFTKNPAASVIATFEGDFSIGTTATADATLSGTDANIIASTSMGIAAVAGVSPMTRAVAGVPVAATIFDNTDGAMELNLNVLIDDLSISGDNQAMRADGFVDIVCVVMGDD